jgi:hypothetical protein
MKSPPVQFPDSVAAQMVEEYIAGPVEDEQIVELTDEEHQNT